MDLSQFRFMRFPLLEIDKAVEAFYAKYYKRPDRILVDTVAMAGIRTSIREMSYLTASDMGGYSGSLHYYGIPIMVGLPVAGNAYSMALYCDDSVEPMTFTVAPIVPQEERQ